MTHTLIIWEEIPENTKLFLVPNEVITEEQREYLTQAQNKYINSVGCEDIDGLSFLNFALSDEKWEDKGFEKYSGLWKDYEVKLEEPLTDQHITNVYHTGFIL